MNKVILMGRLTRDPEIRYSQSECSMAADFINIVAFARAGEFAEKYFRQGMRVLVSGRIQTDSYTNKEGQRVYTIDIIMEDQEFADRKGSASTSTIGNGFMKIPDNVNDEEMDIGHGIE